MQIAVGSNDDGFNVRMVWQVWRLSRAENLLCPASLGFKISIELSWLPLHSRSVQQAESAMVTIKAGFPSQWQGSIAAAMTNWEFPHDRNPQISTAFF